MISRAKITEICNKISQRRKRGHAAQELAFEDSEPRSKRFEF